jgi:hypothetical protein
MDRFVTRQNIERCSRLADKATDATERLRVIKSMAEEWAKFELEFKVRAAIVRPGAAFVGAFETHQEEPRGAD